MARSPPNSFQMVSNGGNKMSAFTDKTYCYFHVSFHLYLLAVSFLEKKNN